MGLIFDFTGRHKKVAAAMAAELARNAVLTGRSVTIGPPDKARTVSTPPSKPTPVARQSATLSGEYIREAELVAVLQISRSTIWRLVQDDKFPRPQRLSARRKVWRVEDVRAWMAKNADSRKTGTSGSRGAAP
jgi:prophage regulatory protein